MICVADMFSAASMSEMHERLREARERAGYASAAAAAEALGIRASTYRAHENGQNEFNYLECQRYARKFGVDPMWLFAGKERDPELKRATDILLAQRVIKSNPAHTPEIETRAGAGGGGIEISAHDGSLVIGQDAIRSWWEIPESYIFELKMKRANARIIEVQGDSMYDPAYPGAPGSIFPGDRLIMDIGDNQPSPPGPFVVWDGLGVVVKMVEVLPQTEPLRLRMMSRNPHYSPYEVLADESRIIGRVKAKISIL